MAPVIVAPSDELQLVVKHGFLEYVPSPSESGRSRALTDSNLTAKAGLLSLAEAFSSDVSTSGAEEASALPSEEDESCSGEHVDSVITPRAHADTWDLQLLSAQGDAPTCGGVAHLSSGCSFTPIASPMGSTGLWFAPCENSGAWVGETSAEPASQAICAATGATTCMLRNIPPEYSTQAVLGHLDAEGFAGLYDFAYLPRNFETGLCFGYGFINFVSPSAAQCFRQRFEGFRDWMVQSDKVGEVSWSDPYQGLEAHVQRYRDSPMMHHTVPDDFKPMLFSGGVRMPFPPPTRNIKAPRVRRSRVSAAP